jgi:hypothetical protein
MTNASTLGSFLFAAALCAAAASAHAVDWGISESTLHDLSYDATNQLLTSQVLRDASAQSRGSRTSRAPPSSTLATARATTPMARQLATALPPAQRAEAERRYGQLLESYHQIEARFGVPQSDVAGAAAAFLAGSLMAYRNEDFPDPYFKPLVAQMREVIGTNADFHRASATARRQMYERLAIIGMSMATTQMALKQQPDAQVQAKVRGAAKRYLEQFLQADPERVAITSRGLVIR